ncbi:unnamed protein product [Caenorhabditis sp. 36 PRJEB53466]|nr:unnamed protein product [Caenorhabditis sp. 36 PRJEB53466]
MICVLSGTDCHCVAGKTCLLRPMRPAVFSLLVVLLLAKSVQADWWDGFTDKVSGGLNDAAGWFKETASPAIRDKFNEYKEKLQDPDTHKNIREWLSEKYDAAAEFTKEEIVPELKKVYEAATAEETTTSVPRMNKENGKGTEKLHIYYQCLIDDNLSLYSFAKREKPTHAALKVAMKSGRRGIDNANKLPTVAPRRQCLVRVLKMNRIHDYLQLEKEFINRQNQKRPLAVQKRNEQKIVQSLRGTPTTLARIHELFDDEKHAVVVVEGSKREWYVPILSIVDKDLLRLNALVMVKAGGMFKTVPTAIVGVLDDKVDSSAMGHKVEKAPKETFDDIGGCESQIQEMKESVELPLTHPEYYEEMGITAPKGVILYGEPGTGKTLLAKAVANSTSATFIRATGADLVQKNSGEGARLVRQLFQMAKEQAPSIVFIDEIDAVGTKRFDTSSRGEQEVQRTLLELLNQLDGFESRGDVKVIMATNRIDSLDPALIRPGRIDRKIELSRPDEKTRQKIFGIHTSGMTLQKDVSYEGVMGKEKSISGAEMKAVCTEAGMLALRSQRKCVSADDFQKAIKTVMLTKKTGAPESFYT